MRILLADDEDLVIEFLKRSLKIDGHTVDFTFNGIEAKKKALSHDYDVIILDIIMPGLDGLEVCLAVRDAGITTPILMLTSNDTETSRVQGLDSGADDYMVKPFSDKELKARLRALQRRPRTIAHNEITAGNTMLKRSRMSIEVNGDKVGLRPKEFSVLEFMMHHPEQGISRDKLLSRVWGITSYSTSNRLEVCIRQIRQKLTTVGSDIQVVTVRGYGYLLTMKHRQQNHE